MDTRAIWNQGAGLLGNIRISGRRPVDPGADSPPPDALGADAPPLEAFDVLLHVASVRQWVSRAHDDSDRQIR